MGTRHTQTVIAKDGTKKIEQYGQWDGYPSGQGIDILNYLKTGDLSKYQENLEKIPLITDKQVKDVNKDANWTKTYPYLSRDCGSDIHKMIEDGEVKFVKHCGEEAKGWCEGFFTIDFSKNEFTSVYYDESATFKLDELPSEEDYLKAMNQNEVE